MTYKNLLYNSSMLGFVPQPNNELLNVGFRDLNPTLYIRKRGRAIAKTSFQ
jgi:hypothetical protein